MGLNITSATLEQMRAWLLECFSNEDDQEDIAELNETEILCAIDRYFDGGVAEFLKTLTPT